MKPLQVSRSESSFLHDQVAADIRRAIAEGEIAQGEKLPKAIDLAFVLGVNKNTVIRALHMLREEGLLEFSRGTSVRVAGTVQRGAVSLKVRELLQFARSQGYKPEEVIALIRAEI